MNLSEETKQTLILTLLGLNEGKQNEEKQNNVKPHAHLIGKACLFRTYSAGVHYGELVIKDGQECLVKNARRVWYWTEACTLSQLAMEGSKDIEKCKIAMTVDEIVLDRVIEIIPLSDMAKKQLQDAPVWKK